MKDNRGFTFIELIVVMCIISILVGTMTYSINSVSPMRAKKFTSDLSALISQCRVNTMSGAPAPTYLELSQDDKGEYYGTLYEGGTDAAHIKAQQKLGGGDISCSFSTGASDSYTISAAQPLRLAFDRTTGASVKLPDIKDAANVPLNAGIVGDYCMSISIASGGGSYTITLVPETGYHSVSR